MKKDANSRRQYIKKLVSERTFSSYKALCTQLNNDGFKCGIETIRKDCRNLLNISYNSSLGHLYFDSQLPQSISISKTNLDSTILDVIKTCKIGTNGPYRLFPPFHYGFNPSLKFYLQAIMITCPLNFEELLYTTISQKFTTYGIITAQVNKGSVLFIFESSNQKDFSKAQAFYNAIDSYLYI